MLRLLTTYNTTSARRLPFIISAMMVRATTVLPNPTSSAIRNRFRPASKAFRAALAVAIWNGFGALNAGVLIVQLFRQRGPHCAKFGEQVRSEERRVGKECR